ncbi:PREDICTED: uncharacterized protein LOC107163512 [Diuraphis noxia]|uniref:uncharacterized protein LOC107163512 n=1 Tax=Diuraphis noxia TaxID=143948 RepID=UPI00076356DF|nr:PREDICTED: uncharacterized protein LOC107163512 [Diuraphis noxia]
MVRDSGCSKLLEQCFPFEMGSGLCRSRDETPRAARRARGFDGLYRKIVFNYAKQWTQYSDKHKKSEKKNNKHIKSRRKKPIISGPFPADPDRLQGDKWQYVILTRLDTEPPPERPPRTKRRRRQETETISGVSSIVRWGSERRRRRSFGRRRQPKPPLSTDEPTTEPVASGRFDVGGGGGNVERALSMVAKNKASPAFDAAIKKSSMWVVLWSGAVVVGRTYAARQNGLLESVARAYAMANDLSS